MRLHTPNEHARLRCEVCQRYCLLDEGQTGFCRTRARRGEKIESFIFGRVSSLHIAPSEAKPLFHFYPGERWLSLGSLGCNFRCPGCQNWHIAHSPVKEDLKQTEELSPEEVVKLSRKEKCMGISWTYNEPALWFEYTLQTSMLAKEAGLLTNYVTNGSISPSALDYIAPYLDAFRVDIKGFSKETYRKVANFPNFKGILEVTSRASNYWKIHIECVTNVIPTLNDDSEELRSIARWIKSELGSDIPWHITRFSPHLHLSHLPPTPVEKLERARELALEEGLQFVYLGNVPGHPAENTYCPRCGSLLIERYHFEVLKNLIKDSSCPSCGRHIRGRFHR